MLTDAQARKRYDTSKPFTVLLGSATHPHCFLEFSGKRSVSVDFLDQQLRMYLSYSFQEKRPNEFFVSMASTHEYLLDTDQMVRGDVFYFNVDGHVYVDHCTIDLQTNKSMLESAEEHDIDVTNNWEPFPEFGHYEGMATINRHIPLFNV